jgi:hypothetical protein
MGQGAVKAASSVQSSLPKNATPAVRALAQELSALNDAGSSIIGKTRAAKAERESAAEFLERKKAVALAEQVSSLFPSFPTCFRTLLSPSPHRSPSINERRQTMNNSLPIHRCSVSHCPPPPVPHHSLVAHTSPPSPP